VEHFRAAVRRNPQGAKAEANLGRAAGRNRELEGSANASGKSPALDPTHALALENLEQVKRESPRDPQ
jgi:Flp pilus assembly protein TadD